MAKKLEEILRLNTRPVGVKMYEKSEEMPRKPLNFKLNICQLVAMARYQGKVNAGTPDKMICAMGAACTGLIATPDAISSGKAAVGPYCKDEEAGKNFMANTFKIGDEGKKYDGIYIQPLESMKEDPDVVVVYCTPAQAMRFVHANTYETGEKIAADTVAEAALCSSIGFAIANHQPTIGFPCAGDRIFGGTQNDELVFVAPFDIMESKIIPGLIETAKGGFSVFPVAPNMNWTPAMPPTYTVNDSDL